MHTLLTVGSENTYTFNETPWQQVVFASGDDASDRRRPDRSRTGGYVITMATEKLFGHGQEDDVSVMASRSFNLPRKIAGSNNSEAQARAFADEFPLVCPACLVRNARYSDATLALGGSCHTGGWNAHHRISRYLRCLDEK